MPTPIPALIRSIFSAEFPTTQRCGYPKVENKITELRERFGMLTKWTTMPMDKQLVLFRELCAHYDSLVFHDKLSCYTYFAHEKTYRTGYFAAQSLKAHAKKYPETKAMEFLRQRCLPVSAPPLPSTSPFQDIDMIFSDKIYRMVQMDRLMDMFENHYWQSSLTRALFPAVPTKRGENCSIERRANLSVGLSEEEDADAAHEEIEALEDSQMELLEVTSRHSMITREPEEHSVTVAQGPPRSLEEKSESFFKLSEIVASSAPRAKFVQTGNEKAQKHSQRSYVDAAMATTPSPPQPVIGLIPDGFHALAKRYKLTTWDAEGIYYPRCSYTALTFFLNRNVPPAPLAPGAVTANGVTHISWDIHRKAWNGERDAIHEIVMRTAVN